MGRFRICERVGSGGMGTVYRAFDERLQRYVAVKEIAGPDAGRVAREAQAGARLNHPGIVTLYELGTEGGRALLVSELVDGATLADLRRCGDLSDREVAEFGADVCEALAHAHDRGVVHRDIKPQNIIVHADDGGRRAKLMDFGIATLAGAPTLTATGEVVGTLAYMAPEQAEGGQVGEAADVYSLAVTLYECWAGTNPVARETPARTARQIGEPLPSLRDHRPDLPGHLVDCLDACLAPDAALRPPLDELDHHLDTSIPRLESERAVPEEAGERPEGARRRGGLLRVAQLAALCAWGLGTALVALAGLPGMALVLAALSAPAILVASSLPWAGVPLIAPLLGAVSAGAVYPVLAGARGGAVERLVLGALGWCWMVCAAAVLGLGSSGGIVSDPPSGWAGSTARAGSALLAPLAAPDALLGAAIFGIAALLLGPILRAPNVAMALLGTLLWTAGLVAAAGLLPGDQVAGTPALVAAAALGAVVIRHRLRGPRSAGRPAPIPGAQALGGRDPAPAP